LQEKYFAGIKKSDQQNGFIDLSKEGDLGQV
jgi:hypothetical protein